MAKNESSGFIGIFVRLSIGLTLLIYAIAYGLDVLFPRLGLSMQEKSIRVVADAITAVGAQLWR